MTLDQKTIKGELFQDILDLGIPRVFKTQSEWGATWEEFP